VASKLRLRVDVCIVGGARLDLPSRLRERLLFFPSFPSVSAVRACVPLFLSLFLPPSLSLSLFYPLSLSVTPVSAACVVARACRRLGTREKRFSPFACGSPRLVLWCCAFCPACAPREAPLREEVIYHAQWQSGIVVTAVATVAATLAEGGGGGRGEGEGPCVRAYVRACVRTCVRTRTEGIIYRIYIYILRVSSRTHDVGLDDDNGRSCRSNRGFLASRSHRHVSFFSVS